MSCKLCWPCSTPGHTFNTCVLSYMGVVAVHAILFSLLLPSTKPENVVSCACSCCLLCCILFSSCSRQKMLLGDLQTISRRWLVSNNSKLTKVFCARQRQEFEEGSGRTCRLGSSPKVRGFTPFQNSASSTESRAKSQGMPIANTSAMNLSSSPRRLTFTCTTERLTG